ncbi:MAG: hypothetical protein JXB34_10815 [Bacteroidales bacterium]|nr:hypothetical protein [Bacteroidales bacterium]
MSKKFRLFSILAIFLTNSSLWSQVVFEDAGNKSIYQFLDELANENIIVINSAIKPFSRSFIAKKLAEASLAEAELGKRQRYELNFYLKDFNKELLPEKFSNKRFDVFYYKDSVFSFTLNPIIGGQVWKNENGINYHRYFGAEAFGYAGKHLGMYASLRDNTEKYRLADTGKITLRSGGKYRGGDYSEMRGGVTWGWNWGYVALVKDRIEWGNSYRYPNILSAKAPSFAQFKWQLKPCSWFEFNYVHGWLVSEIIDSSRSYNYNGIPRNVFHSKYIAANMFTFTPWKRLNVSLGNSIVYSDQYLNPAYFIPVFFYKSVDHTYNGNTNAAGQNSQMFFDISSRLIPKTHLYYSMFIDVLSFSTVFSETENVNHWSMLGGLRVSNLIGNTCFTIEFIQNNPLVYKNDNPTTLYSSNRYNLGHYLGDNARELYFELGTKPLAMLEIKAWYSLAKKGPDYQYIRKTGALSGKKTLESIEWEQQQIALQMNYQVLNNFVIFLTAEKQDVTGDTKRYNSTFYQGNTLTWSFGMHYGFY